MPAITNKNSTILVTGANGFIGSWVVNTLLSQGYSVRGTVRTEAKGKYLLEVFKSFGDRFTIYVVDDMSKEGVWNKPVQGVDGVVHIAADVQFLERDPQKIIEPAVKGVVGLLESVKKYGSSVKRVVFTSTCGAIKAFTTVPMTLSEEDWNDAAVKECEEQGANSTPLDAYAASKTLAERRGWEWYNQHKSEISWDIVNILPPYTFGPVIHDADTPERLNATNSLFYQTTVLGNYLEGSPLSTPGHGFCDVRDIAEAHVRALETPAAGGERIMILQSPFVWQDAIDAMNSVVPSPWKSHTAPLAKGDPEGERVRNITWIVEKEKRIFGMKLRTLKETARDILEDYEKHGWR